MERFSSPVAECRCRGPAPTPQAIARALLPSSRRCASLTETDCFMFCELWLEIPDYREFRARLKAASVTFQIASAAGVAEICEQRPGRYHIPIVKEPVPPEQEEQGDHI